MARMALWFYGGFAAIAYAVMFWWYGWALFVPAPGWFFWSVIAWIAGVAVCWLSKELLGQFDWAREMESEFVNILGPLELGEVLILAASSAIGEESVFRGVLQPWLGLVNATLVFALVHAPMSKKLRPWPIFALAIGFLLGGLTWVSGSIIPPIVTHATVNGLNLYVIGERARRLGIPRRNFPPDPDEMV
jgi:membrane protease YdiL (CAAX protease family)